jgi:hypothetical protein
MFSHSHLTRVTRPTCTLGVMAAAALLWAPLASAADASSHATMNHQLPAWAEQLKGQTIIEDTMSGKGDRAAMVEQQHQRVMEHMSHDPPIRRRWSGHAARVRSPG